MIVTVTLNPAIDKTVEIDYFSVNAVNRIRSLRADAGGKGINVAKVIARLGGKIRAAGILAGKAGEYIEQCLDEAAIAHDFVFIPGETRTNLKIVDPIGKTNTDINEAGPDVPAEALMQVEEQVMALLDQRGVVVFSGSVPGNVPKGIYGQWISRAVAKGAKTILDADGELLEKGLAASPYLVKPNIHEMEKLVGRKIHSVQQAAIMGKELLQKYSVNMLVISMGEEGALFLSKEQAIIAQGIPVEVCSTVGAGDAMVGALAYSLEQQYSLEKMVALAVAAGTASVMTAGTQPGSIEVIRHLERKVTWKILDNY